MMMIYFFCFHIRFFFEKMAYYKQYSAAQRVTKFRLNVSTRFLRTEKVEKLIHT